VGLPRYTIYKYCKTAKGWRYCKPAWGRNNKLKPNVVLVGGREETHPEGMYYLNVDGQWEKAGTTAVEAQDAQRKRLARQVYERQTGEKLPETPIGTSLGVAVERYFSNLEAQGKDPKTIRTYRSAVDPFVSQCKKACVEEITKQDVTDFMGWLRRQPVPQRKNGNPERTYYNKVSHVTIFLKAFGRERLLKKSEYPQYEEKAVTAHTEEELDFLYSHADAEQRFLLDFALGSGFRDGELAHAEYNDLVGNVLEVKRKPHLRWHPKQHHCRKVLVTQSLADAIRDRGDGKPGLIFPNSEGKPNQHLLRDLQALTKGSAIHTELHKLRKTWATRLALAGVPLHVLQKRLGHKSLATTQKYLADVDLTSQEMSKAVEAASYTPKPKLVVVVAGARDTHTVPSRISSRPATAGSLAEFAPPHFG